MRVSLLLVLCVSGLAQAQDLEMDLTEDTPKLGPEFKPSIALIGVAAADADEVTQGRARLLETAVLKFFGQSDQFGTVYEPAMVARAVGTERLDAAKKCNDFECFESILAATKAHRLVRFTVAKAGAGSSVTMVGFDPGFNEVLSQTADSGEKAEKTTFAGVQGKTQAQKDREFLRNVGPFVKEWLGKLSTPNGKLVVDNVEQAAQVLVDGLEVGTGSFDTIVQRGTRRVKVNATGYLPFEQQVTIEPGKTATLKVSLVARPVEVVREAKPEPARGPSVFARPGLYVAVAGAIAAGVGVALGQMSAGVSARLKAGGDPVAVTRTEAKTAATQAVLANVLVGVGGAAVVGGVVWVIVTPAVGPSKNSLEPSESSIGGAVIEFGGRF